MARGQGHLLSLVAMDWPCKAFLGSRHVGEV